MPQDDDDLLSMPAADAVDYLELLTVRARAYGSPLVARLPVELADIIIEAARRGLHTKRGRPPLTDIQRLRETLIIRQARERKTELMQHDMSADDAKRQAAEEARADLLEWSNRSLAVDTIMRRMDGDPDNK